LLFKNSRIYYSMKRQLIRADGTTEIIEVGNGFESWNKAIGARMGEIVYLNDGRELWMDEEGRMVSEPVINEAATDLAAASHGYPMVGDAIIFEAGDIT
jgi:hypothetical protein